MSSSNSYRFDGVGQLMALVNDEARVPRADDKPVYAVTKDDDAEYRLSNGGVNSVKAERVENAQVIYNRQTGETFGVVTGEYEIVNPPEFIGPLCDELNDRDRTDVSGFINMYDGGKSAYGEVLFEDTHSVWPQDRSEANDPVRVGLTFRWSHDGAVSVRSSGFAQDGACKNTMRQVTDNVYVKHAGDVNARVEWESEWAGLLNQLGAFSETLQAVIDDALNTTLFDLHANPFSDEWRDMTDPLVKYDPREDGDGGFGPISDGEWLDLHGFFDYLGFPGYLAGAATERLMSRLSQRDDPTQVSAWDTYSAATYALTHESRFDAGSSSDDDYHRTASEILTNPTLALDSARQGLAAEMQPDTDDGQELADALVVESNVGDAARTMHERDEQLRATFGGDDA